MAWLHGGHVRFNNFLLMVILIWLQVGFAMVLLSSAIKAVPGETLEAARIDGASELQIFFRVIVPQIWGTFITVFITVLIMVLKVFDIVFVMTNGNFKTERHRRPASSTSCSATATTAGPPRSWSSC